MFSIEMLAADYGDCLWLEYGSGGQTCRMLIDGGPGPTVSALRRRLLAVPPEQRRFELLVVTHIDADHLDGIHGLLQDPPEKVHFDQIWFNGYRQVDEVRSAYLGPLTAEYFSRGLEKLESKRPGVWNGAFGGHAICAPDDGEFPVFTLDGGLKLTVLGPSHAALVKLADEWDESLAELEKKPGEPGKEEESEIAEGDSAAYLGGINVEQLARQKSRADRAVSNGSSIVLLAEFEGQRCLLSGDALPKELTAAVALFSGGTRLDVSAFKAPHHGSRNNNTNDLYSAVNATNYLISSSGANFKHPHEEGVARMLYNKRGHATLHFNYRSRYNTAWDDSEMMKTLNYSTHYPVEGLRINL